MNAGTLDPTIGETMAERQTHAGLFQMIDQIDQKHEDGHKRLRDDMRELQEQHANLLDSLGLLRDKQSDTANRIGNIEKTPPNVENVIMTPRVLVAIVIFSITVAGGIWSSTAGLRSDVRDILTRMDSQRMSLEASDKLQEVQATAMRVAVDDMKRRQELQQYEIQALKEVIITGKYPKENR